MCRFRGIPPRQGEKGAGSADFKRLITGFQDWQCEVSLDSRFVLQRPLQCRVKFSLTMKTFRQTRQVHRKQGVERHTRRIYDCLGVIISAQIDVS